MGSICPLPESHEKMMFQLSLRAARDQRSGGAPRHGSNSARDVGRGGGQPHAYRDSALGIACGQTISQPFVVAYMTEQLQLQSITGRSRSAPVPDTRPPSLSALRLRPDDRALPDAGRPCARPRLAKLGCDNVEVLLGDGFDVPADAGDSTASS